MSRLKIVGPEKRLVLNKSSTRSINQHFTIGNLKFFSFVSKNLILVKGPENAGVPQNCGAGLLQTSITSVKNSYLSRIVNFEKNRFFEEILQRALFKTLVITIVFDPILDGGGGSNLNTAQKPLGVES